MLEGGSELPAVALLPERANHVFLLIQLL